MSGSEEVARVEAVVGADISALVRAYEHGEVATQRFASKTDSALGKAEQAAYRSASSMAKSLERASVANSAAAAKSETAIDKIARSHATGAAAAERASTQSVAAIRSQASATMQAAAQLSTSYSKMGSSVERAAMMQQNALGRAAAGAKAHAQQTAHAARVSETSFNRQANAAERAAFRTNAAQTSMASRASGVAKFAAAGVGITGAYGAARIITDVLNTGAKFEAQMSRVMAVTGATTAQFDALRGAAIRMGADTVYGSTEVAQGMEILGAAGMSANETIQAMPGLLDGATAAGEDFAGTASILTASIGAFNLKSTDSTHIMDVLAAAAMASDASIGDMGNSLKFAAPTAKAFGMSIEETAAVLTLFAEAGIKGSRGGTALNASLLQLADGRGASGKMMKELGLSISDATGKVKPFSTVIDELSVAMKGMGDAEKLSTMSALFGQEAAPAMLKLLGDGREKLDGLAKGFERADGAAKKMAATMTDNVAGDLEQLKGAWEQLSIEVSEAFRPQLRSQIAKFKVYIESDDFEQDAQAVVGAFIAVGSAIANTTMFLNDHRDAIMAAAAAYVALKAVAGGANALSGVAMLAGGGRGKGAAAGIGAASGAASIGATGAAAAANVGRVATFAKVAGMAARGLTGIGLATVGLQLLYEYGKASRDTGDDVEDTTARVGELVTKLNEISSRDASVTVTTRQREVPGGFGPAAPGPSLGDERTQIEAKGELIRLEGEYANAVKKRQAAADAADQAGRAALADSGEYVKRQREIVEQHRSGAISSDEAAKKLRDLDSAYEDAQSTLADANKKLEEARQKVDEVESSTGKLKRAMGLASNTFRGALKDLPAAFAAGEVSAVRAGAAIKRMANTPLNMRIAREVLSEMTTAERKAQFGTASINAILQGIGKTSPSRQWAGQFAADLAAARAEGARGVTVQVRMQSQGLAPTATLPGGKDGNPGTPWATGGPVRGPGTGTSDDIPAWLSNGEHVLTAAEVSAMGGHGAVERLRAAAKSGDLPRYKDGGAVWKAGPDRTPPRIKKGEDKEAFAKRRDTWRSKQDGYQERASNQWQARTDHWALRESVLENAVIKAERSKDPKKIGNALRNLGAMYANSINDPKLGYGPFRREVAWKWFDTSERGGVQQTINGAMRNYDGIVARLAEMKQPGMGGGKFVEADDRSVLEKLRDKYDAAFAQLDVELATAEGTTGTEDDEAVKARIRAKYGEQAGELQRGMPGFVGADAQTANQMLASAIRGSQSEPAAVSDDARAQYDQAIRARDIATENARLSEAALRTFSGPGDIGSGGRNALWAGAGQSGMEPQYHFHSTVPATAQQMAAVADMALQGGQVNGYAAAAYTPVRQIGA